jgi:hypothetical protein
MAGLWDEHERTLLRNAYEDVPFPDDLGENEPLEAGFDPDGDNVQIAADDDPAAIGEAILAANTRPTQNGGAASKPTKQSAPPVPLPAPARSAEDRAKVIFGETSGLYPQSIDPEGPENDPRNWVSDSFDNLQAARRYIGIVASRNRKRESKIPNPEIPLEVEVWENAMSAGTAAQNNPDLLDARITNFYIRGDRNRTKEAFKGLSKFLTIGPFRSVGKGDAGAGNNVYIEFYGKR